MIEGMSSVPMCLEFQFLLETHPKDLDSVFPFYVFFFFNLFSHVGKSSDKMMYEVLTMLQVGLNCQPELTLQLLDL